MHEGAPDVRNRVTVRKTKFDGSTSWEWDGDLVDGDDEWLIVYHGVGLHERLRHGEEPEVPAPHALHYLSTAGPLAVCVLFDLHGEVTEYRCDACLPARMDRREVTFVDLDLDVVAAPDLSWRIKDEDVFLEHAREMGYTEETVAVAREGIRLAIERIEHNRMPFDGSPHHLLGAILAASGPL
jgi:protein associated with RNAse G/E